MLHRWSNTGPDATFAGTRRGRETTPILPSIGPVGAGAFNNNDQQRSTDECKDFNSILSVGHRLGQFASGAGEDGAEHPLAKRTRDTPLCKILNQGTGSPAEGAVTDLEPWHTSNTRYFMELHS